MDDAPCLIQTLSGLFSNITDPLLAKRTTSKSQPWDAGIIANWKVHYRKRMLQYVWSQGDGEKNASEIVKCINALIAIELGRQASNDVRQSSTKLWSRKTLRSKGNKTNWLPKGAVIKCFAIYPQRRNNLTESYLKKVFLCFSNDIMISLQAKSPRTMKNNRI